MTIASRKLVATRTPDSLTWTVSDGRWKSYEVTFPKAIYEHIKTYDGWRVKIQGVRVIAKNGKELKWGGNAHYLAADAAYQDLRKGHQNDDCEA